MKIPFDPYDFFGYLASGLVVLVGLELGLGFPQILSREYSAVDITALILADYIAGQIIASPAKWLLEDILVSKVLKAPSVNLFRVKRPAIFGWLFPGYFTPLPFETSSTIRSKAKSDGFEGSPEGLFLFVRFKPTVLADEMLIARLDAFRNKYGFNRNLSFALLLVGGGLLAKASLDDSAGQAFSRYWITALSVGVILFYRYLKFYRQYSFELFNSYGNQDQ